MASHRRLHCSSTKPSVPTSSTAAATRRRPRLQASKPSFATLASALTKERLRDRVRSSWSTTTRYASNKGPVLIPGRENLAFSSHSSSHSSSLPLNICRWRISWFRRCRLWPFAASMPASPETPPPYPRRESWDPALSSGRQDWMPNRSSRPPPAVCPVKKPLRESESVLAQRAQAITMIGRPIPAADDAIGTVGSRKDRESTVVISPSLPKEDRFLWAQKYRPKALKEFICNRERAEELGQMDDELAELPERLDDWLLKVG